MIGDLFAQLAARGIHIAAELAAHGDIDARLLQNADECLEMLRRRRPERALFHVVERMRLTCAQTRRACFARSFACSGVSFTPSIMAYSKEMRRPVVS